MLCNKADLQSSRLQSHGVMALYLSHTLRASATATTLAASKRQTGRRRSGKAFVRVILTETRSPLSSDSKRVQLIKEQSYCTKLCAWSSAQGTGVVYTFPPQLCHTIFVKFVVARELQNFLCCRIDDRLPGFAEHPPCRHSSFAPWGHWPALGWVGHPGLEESSNNDIPWWVTL